ncbi:MAG: pseudouridine-5'-phosphate glycosidase [Woeseia sp.]
MQLEIAAEVRDALACGNPVVALETAVLTHGMAFPDNVETALSMEDAVRAENACPATIGVVRGKIVVGMDPNQVEAFGTAKRDSIWKCSRRDLPAVVAAKWDGSLTVAGTIAVAHAASIRMFATGGIGGVHRGHPQDVSADLYELGRTPMVGVCAGAKSILDLPLTLEVLESQGVMVLGLGTVHLPAFFARDSGLALPHFVQTADEAADVLRAWRDLDSVSGLLVTVPVPADRALDPAEAEYAIEQAVRDADEYGIGGSRLTPYILQRVVELTDGRSLVANKALLLNNALIASRLARKAGLGRLPQA